MTLYSDSKQYTLITQLYTAILLSAYYETHRPKTTEYNQVQEIDPYIVTVISLSFLPPAGKSKYTTD